MAFCTTMVVVNTIALLFIDWIVVNNQNKTAEGLDRTYKNINALNRK